MKLAAVQGISFEEYLAYEDGSDNRYELVRGELVAMSVGTGKHGKVIKYLDDQFNGAIDRSGLNYVSQRMTVGVQSSRCDRFEH
jgi:Uma2 family endonuclease